MGAYGVASAIGSFGGGGGRFYKGRPLDHAGKKGNPVASLSYILK